MNETTDPAPDSGGKNSKPDDDFVLFDDMLAINKMAAVKYHETLLTLLAEQPTHPITRYVRKRGLTPDDLETWQIGYAPPAFDFLTSRLRDIDTKAVQVALDAGLLTQKDRGPYDFFRDRLLLPIKDHQGYIVGFTGRSLTEDKRRPKYLNTAENTLFRKEELLYGWHQAGKEIRRKRHCTLTEGNTDVIALHRANILDAVAKGGSALTDKQLTMISEQCDSVTLVYDRDPNGSGQKALKKDLNRLLRAGVRVKVFVMPDLANGGKTDADNWVRRAETPLRRVDGGMKEFPAPVRPWTPVPFAVRVKADLADTLRKVSVDGIMLRAAELLTADDLDEQMAGMHEVVELLAEVRDTNYREEYIKRIAKDHVISRRVLGKQVADRRGKSKGGPELTENELPDWITDPADFYTWGVAERVVKGDPKRTGYYFQGGMGQVAASPITNFVIQPLYHVKDQGNVRRIVKINNGFVERVIELTGSMINSVQNFETELSDAGNFFAHEDFARKHLKRIVGRVMERTPEVFPIKTLGYQPEGFFAFSNAVFNGHLANYNEHGVVEVADRHFFSPALSPVFANFRSDDDAYKHDRYLSFSEAPIAFHEWCGQMMNVYGERAMLGMLFVVATLFKDIVIRVAKIPLIYCYGPKDSGKSTFAESILYLFFSGKDSMGNLIKPVNFASEPTLSAFWAAMSRFRNCPMVFNEFDENTVAPMFKTALKSAWDNEARSRMSKDGGGRMDDQQVNCTPIIVGQYLADSDDGSVVSRSLVFEFKDRKENPFTPAESAARDQLRRWERQGLSGILTELLPHRRLVESEFDTVIARVKDELFADLETRQIGTSTRTQQNVSCLLALYDLFAPHINWPMSREQVWEYSRRLIGEMNNLLHESDVLNGFWSMVAYLYDRGELEDGWDFKIETKTSVKLKVPGGKTEERTFENPVSLLYIRVTNLHKPYSEYTRRTSKMEPLKENTLVVYLKQQGYYVGQVGSTYFSRASHENRTTSALVLRYDLLAERTGICLESFEEDGDTRPVRTMQGRMMGEADTIPMNGGELWHFILEVAEVAANNITERYKVHVYMPTTRLGAGDQDRLLPGSRWEITGLYSEKPWVARDGSKQVKRVLDAETASPLDPAPVPGSQPQYLGDTPPPTDKPF